jgi:hypothetical protein
LCLQRLIAGWCGLLLVSSGDTAACIGAQQQLLGG